MAGLGANARLDTRPEMKITKHSGSEKDWPIWSLRFEAYTGLLGFEEVMSAAADSAVPIRYGSLNEVNQEISKALWYLLISYTDGKSIGVVRLAGKHGGLEAWRLPKVGYEGKQGGRFTVMLGCLSTRRTGGLPT